MKKVTKGLLTVGLAALVVGACGDTIEVMIDDDDPPVMPVPPDPDPPVEPDPRPATVSISGLRSGEDRNTSVSPSNVSGDILVILDVENNDEQVASVGLTLAGQDFGCRGISADASPFAASGQAELECYLGTSTAIGACEGQQLDPMFANGEHTLGAYLTTSDGTRRETPLTTQVTLNNRSYVMLVADLQEDRSMVHDDGYTLYGGPDDGGTPHQFHACPVSYAGTQVDQMMLQPLGFDFAAGDEGGGEDLGPGNPKALAFDAPTQAVPVPNGRASGRTISDGDTFTWEARSAWNRGVEAFGALSDAEGVDYQVELVASSLRDADGRNVSSEFYVPQLDRSTGGVYYFDFKPPTPTAITIGTSARNQGAVVAGTYYSASNTLTLDASDEGSGLDPESFGMAVGDCALNPPDAEDRNEVAFDALFTGARSISVADLDEDDGMRTGEDDDPDSNGADCYVAELTAVSDNLGNVWTGGTTPASWLQTVAFGVDKTPPALTGITYPDNEQGPYFGASFTTPLSVNFTAIDAVLGSGDAGTPLGATSITVPNPNTMADSTVLSIGEITSDTSAYMATIDLSMLPDSTGARTGANGAFEVTVSVSDTAVPPNTSTFTRDIIYDTVPPTIDNTSGPFGSSFAQFSVTLNVAGTINDNTAVGEYGYSVRRTSDNLCVAADDEAISTVRYASAPVSGGNLTSVPFSTAISVAAPYSMSQNMREDLCVLISASDAAGNTAPLTAAGRSWITTWAGRLTIPADVYAPMNVTASRIGTSDSVVVSYETALPDGITAAWYQISSKAASADTSAYVAADSVQSMTDGQMVRDTLTGLTGASNVRVRSRLPAATTYANTVVVNVAAPAGSGGAPPAPSAPVPPAPKAIASTAGTLAASEVDGNDN